MSTETTEIKKENVINFILTVKRLFEELCYAEEFSDLHNKEFFVNLQLIICFIVKFL